MVIIQNIFLKNKDSEIGWKNKRCLIFGPEFFTSVAQLWNDPFLCNPNHTHL